MTIIFEVFKLLIVFFLGVLLADWLSSDESKDAYEIGYLKGREEERLEKGEER